MSSTPLLLLIYNNRLAYLLMGLDATWYDTQYCQTKLIFLVIYKEFILWKKKRMAQVIDGRAMSVGEILGGAAQDSKGAQLKFKKVKDSYPPVFEAKGTDNKVYSFEMTSISVRLSIRSTSSYPWHTSSSISAIYSSIFG
jgi:hypothetical protein